MRSLFVIFILLVSGYSLAQTPIRVQNGQSLQTAIDNAPAGSTILVDGGSYGAVTLGKKITLIGAGGFVENPTIITSILFQLGSSNSSILGFKVNGGLVDNKFISIKIWDNLDNILIMRNYIPNTIETVSDCNPCGSINNLSIIHNLTGGVVLGAMPTINNFTVKNNILGGFMPVHSCCYGSRFGNSIITGVIVNNTFANPIQNYPLYTISPAYINDCYLNQSSSIIFKNNIFYNDGNYGICPFYSTNYNAITADNGGYPYNSTNTLNVDVNSLFVGFPINISGESLPFQFQLAPNSPARGAGENGIDCGAFGGTDPFPLSGTTGPQIYELSAPSSVSSGQTLNVTVKAKVSN